MDTRRWGSGERLVFEPYTKEVYDETFRGHQTSPTTKPATTNATRKTSVSMIRLCRPTDGSVQHNVPYLIATIYQENKRPWSRVPAGQIPQ
jgi:hypothetical protein